MVIVKKGVTMEGKTVKKVFYEGKCIMEYDLSIFTKGMSGSELDQMYENFNEFWNYMRDLAYEKTDIPAINEKKIDKVWIGNENLRELQIKNEKIARDKTDDPFESNELLGELMEKELSKEEFELWEKLSNESVRLEYTHLSETDFYAFFTFMDSKGNKDHTVILL